MSDRCNLGVGCDEYGVCYAEYHGQPEMCGRTPPMPANNPKQPEVTQVLKGVGKINGDGWKDTTKVGEVVFVWNEELPPPYSPGLFPRVGNEIWSASTDQYDFEPATAAEVRALFEAHRIATERRVLEEAARAICPKGSLVTTAQREAAAFLRAMKEEPK